MDIILLSLIFVLATGGFIGTLSAVILIWHIPSMNLFLFVMSSLGILSAGVMIACGIELYWLVS